MTNCEAIIAQFSDWQEGELPLAAATAIQTHLSQCAACQAQWQRWQQEEQAYREVLGQVVEIPDLTAKIMQRIAAAEHHSSPYTASANANAVTNRSTVTTSTSSESLTAPNEEVNQLLANNILIDHRLTKEFAAGSSLEAEREGIALWRLVAGLAGLGVLGGQMLLAISNYWAANVGLGWLSNVTTWVPSKQTVMFTAQLPASSWESLGTSLAAITQFTTNGLASLSVSMGAVLVLLIIQLVGSKWLMSDVNLAGKTN